jgi:hypothetical protein
MSPRDLRWLQKLSKGGGKTGMEEGELICSLDESALGLLFCRADRGREIMVIGDKDKI